MPLYEYRRPDGTTFDVLQSFDDDALTTDPETGVPVQRVLHAPALHFKGSGFYSTDVGREKQRKMLQRSAEQGANDHDDKMREKRKKKSSLAISRAESASPPRSDRPGRPSGRPHHQAAS